ncbi:LytTR family DNA-binding domain-containing protein [Actinokineospora sp. PR83]|uniref:LytR/AlgR family response regulator transcription factor n=1 Tax=Actinokineospora sp. PR83 TaxID=2884908 RepID=UPI001F175443|nr:LytTR family DNA-binding domain-containing protein [Actinokineospora sp. PR83]MCG8917607.1 LytTR family DNA-binding domain-containing protein [Actinokineospora sp. PR83]
MGVLGKIALTVSTATKTPGLVVLAVDDEQAGMDELVILLNGNRQVRRVLKAFDATEALRLLSGDDEELAARKAAGMPVVDVVFADLDMPGLTGMELAKVVAGFKPAPVLVFVTAHSHEAVAAFELGAVDYILKPAKQPRMDKAMERVLTKINSDGGGGSAAVPEQRDDEVIPVELAGTTKLVSRAAVRWVEAQGDYARLYTSDGSHLVRIPLAQLEERWEKAGFVRIHRSYLVPLSLITELRMGGSGYSVVIGHEEKVLPVSRRHTRELKDRLVRGAGP